MEIKEKNISIKVNPQGSNALERKLLNLNETAAILGIKIFTVRRLIKAKRLKTIRFNERGRHLVSVAEIERILKAHTNSEEL